MANTLNRRCAGLAWAMELVTRTHHRPSLMFLGELIRLRDMKQERALLLTAGGRPAVHWR